MGRRQPATGDGMPSPIPAGAAPGGLVFMLVDHDGMVISTEVITDKNGDLTGIAERQGTIAGMAVPSGPVTLNVFDGDTGECVHAVVCANDDRPWLLCTVCLTLNQNEAATTIASGHALCTKHFMTTQPGISRKIRKAWRRSGLAERP